MVRVWLYQTKTDGSCANYQYFLEASKIAQIKKVSQSDIVCKELNLPHSLNTERYLGKEEQKDFHYMERFRVDNLIDNTAHAIEFTLKEPTLIRVVAPVHKHIEFDLVLKAVTQGYSQSAKTIVDSSAKGFEDSIFV